MLFLSRKDGIVLSYEEQHTFSFPTDTTVPVTPVPIYYLHAGEHAFCSRPGCLCHRYAAQLEALLHGVVDGELKLRSVSNGTIAWREVR
jgi:hypothetical protein